MTLGCGKQTHYITRHGIAVFSKVITQSHPLLQFSHKINHFLLISNQFKHPPLSLKKSTCTYGAPGGWGNQSSAGEHF